MPCGRFQTFPVLFFLFLIFSYSHNFAVSQFRNFVSRLPFIDLQADHLLLMIMTIHKIKLTHKLYLDYMGVAGVN